MRCRLMHGRTDTLDISVAREVCNVFVCEAVELSACSFQLCIFFVKVNFFIYVEGLPQRRKGCLKAKDPVVQCISSSQHHSLFARPVSPSNHFPDLEVGRVHMMKVRIASSQVSV